METMMELLTQKDGYISEMLACVAEQAALLAGDDFDALDRVGTQMQGLMRQIDETDARMAEIPKEDHASPEAVQLRNKIQGTIATMAAQDALLRAQAQEKLQGYGADIRGKRETRQGVQAYVGVPSGMQGSLYIDKRE